MSNTIKQMTRDKLQELISQSLDKISKIDEFVTNMDTTQKQITSYHLELTKEGWLLAQIKESLAVVKEQSEEIEEAYDKIAVGNDGDSILTDAENTLKKILTIEEKVSNYNQRLFGSPAVGEKEAVVWVSQKIDKFYSEQQKKYKDFFDRIEKELDSGTTSVALAQTFSKKVEDFGKESLVRWWVFLVFLIWAIIYLWFTLFRTPENLSFNLIITEILYRLPLYIFGIRLVVFVSNRRAEAKKLAEAYKHKEVLARSFVGYRETIKELTPDDTELLKQHMQALLATISVDSSSFLSNEWDKHPARDIITNIFKWWKQ